MNKKALGKGLGSIFKELGSPVLNNESGDFVHQIELSEISPNPFQPRREFNIEEIEGLSASISQKGLLQPILVRRHNNKYQIISGERRFRAVELIGLKTIQAYIRQNVSDRDMMEISLIENIQRVQLSPIEEAGAYAKLSSEFGLSHDELAKKLSKSRSAVTNTLRLLKLNPAVQKYIDEGKISAGHARALLQFSSDEQLKYAEKIIAEKLNVRSAENLKPKEKAPQPSHDPNLSTFLDKIKYSLGSKIGLKGDSQKGKIEIYYHTQEELQNIGDVIIRGSS